MKGEGEAKEWQGDSHLRLLGHLNECEIVALGLFARWCILTTVRNKYYIATQYTYVGFPGGSVVKNPPASAGNTGDASSIPGSGRSPGGGNGNPLQYSFLENPMDRGAWQATVHGITKSQTWLGDWTQSTHTHISKHTCNESQPDVMSEVTYGGYSTNVDSDLPISPCSPIWSPLKMFETLQTLPHT